MKVRMTESQLRNIIKRLSENETLTVDANIDNGDVKTGVVNTKHDAEQNGLKNYKIAVDPKEVNETRVYKKSQLKEARRNKLNRNAISFRKGDLR